MAPAGGRERSGLVCSSRGLSCLIPTEAIEQAVEVEVDPPPPLAAPWLEGYGVLADEIVVVTRLHLEAPARAETTALKVIRLALSGRITWGVCIDVVGAFAVAPCTDAPFDRDRTPPWVRQTARDRHLAWLDVAALVSHLELQG